MGGVLLSGEKHPPPPARPRRRPGVGSPRRHTLPDVLGGASGVLWRKAESGVDYPFDEPAAAGARFVCLCSAPGLYSRPLREARWRRGLHWWEGAGLTDARRHARRLGIWIALATQAGSTADEDLPGLAPWSIRTGRSRRGCRTGVPANWWWRSPAAADSGLRRAGTGLGPAPSGASPLMCAVPMRGRPPGVGAHPKPR